MPTFEPSTVVLAILVASLALFLSDRLRYDLVALLVLLALSVTRVLEPGEAFAGFASEPVLVIAALCVFGHALTRWGVGDLLSRRLLAGSGTSEPGLVLRITVVSAVLASVMSDAAVVAILLPIVGSIARQRGIALSRLLLPVSYGAFLGDLLLVIGSAKNIAVNGVLASHGVTPFGMFEFTHYGLLVLGIGTVYLAGPGRRLLPRTALSESLTERYHVPRFVTEVLVEPSSTLINRSLGDLPLFGKDAVQVLGVVRAGNEGTILAPGPYNRIRSDDVLILQGQPDAIVRMRRELGLRERESVVLGDTRLSSSDVQLVEALVPPGSDLAGRTLAEASFRANTNLNVLGIAKHGEHQGGGLQATPLAVGDTLLVQGHRRDLDRARAQRQILVISELEPPRAGRGAWISTLLLLGVLLSSLFQILPLHVAAVSGAVLLVLSGCVEAREVYRQIEWTVVVLVGGMLALGRAFDKHGVADDLAAFLVDVGGGLSNPYLTLALLLCVSTLLAQTTTSIATAVILTPVALAIAETTGYSDRPFLMAVLTGTNCAFMSPVAHPANAMVVGPGGYRFRDFLRVGAPLTLLILVFAVLVLPILWPF